MCLLVQTDPPQPQAEMNSWQAKVNERPSVLDKKTQAPHPSEMKRRVHTKAMETQQNRNPSQHRQIEALGLKEISHVHSNVQCSCVFCLYGLYSLH